MKFLVNIEEVVCETFEVDADPAAIHTEGAAAPEAENLILGIVDLTPVSIKKWIKKIYNK